MKLIELVGTMVADGAAINAWRVAQEFWSKGELVPKSIWQHVQANANLIQANLAEEREGGIYVSGSSQYLSWVAERRRSASAGGKKSAQKRGKPPVKSEVKAKQTPSKSKQTQASGSYSSSGSGSGSGTDSGIENPSDSKPQAFIAAYCERFKQRWGSNPEIKGKEAGIAGRLAKGWSQEKAELYLDAFFAMPDVWVIKTKHTLAALETKLNEVAVFANSGKFTSNKEAIQADDSLALAAQIQRIRGEAK